MADDLPRELAELLGAPDHETRERAWTAFLERYHRYLLGTARFVGKGYDEAMDRYGYVLEELRAEDFHRLRAYAVDAESKFSTWLVVVVRRLCRDFERKKYGRVRGTGRKARERGDARRRLQDLVAEELDPGRHEDRARSNPERELRERELHLALAAAMDGFEAEERLLVKLRFEDDLPVTRIAEVLHLNSEFQVYRRLKKITATLKARLEKEGIHDPSP
jgi:RNA polymerase sigma factor (sigma-70 family)